MNNTYSSIHSIHASSTKSTAVYTMSAGDGRCCQVGQVQVISQIHWGLFMTASTVYTLDKVDAYRNIRREKYRNIYDNQYMGSADMPYIGWYMDSTGLPMYTVEQRLLQGNSATVIVHLWDTGPLLLHYDSQTP